MTVTLNPEQERVVAEAIQAGLICTPSEVVDAGVESIRERLKSGVGAAARQEAIDAAAERLLKFGEKYRFSLAGITIKDLVNEGRR
jgi:Arc/MetJ-type ribon-helix-helix transcriptional regulator